jgi:hypothetical protein
MLREEEHGFAADRSKAQGAFRQIGEQRLIICRPGGEGRIRPAGQYGKSW